MLYTPQWLFFFLLHWHGTHGWVLHGEKIASLTTRSRREINEFTRLLMSRNSSNANTVTYACKNIKTVSPIIQCIYAYTYMDRILLKVPTEYISIIGEQTETSGSLLYGYTLGLDIHVQLTHSINLNQEKIAKPTSFLYSGVPWHLDILDRVEQGPKLDTKYNGSIRDGGNHTDVYVLDTGIDCTHTAFQPQKCFTLAQFQTVEGLYFTDCQTETCALDDHGHGTLCGSLINGVYTGVAKNSSVYAIKVLDATGSGYMADVFMALDFLLTYLDTIVPNRKSVVSVSIGCACVDDATCSECARECSRYIWTEHMELLSTYAKRNVPIVMAAGNDGCDMCTYDLQTTQNTIVVGASTMLNTRALFSNYGECVDFLAPGVDIIGPLFGTNTKYSVSQGTSMATPLVAGTIALFNPNNIYTLSDVRSILLNNIVENIVSVKYSVEYTYNISNMNNITTTVSPTETTSGTRSTAALIIALVASSTCYLSSIFIYIYCTRRHTTSSPIEYKQVPQIIH